MEPPLPRLPTLTVGGAACSLPLADASAAAHFAALLETDHDARLEILCEALRNDPALVVWCVVHPRRAARTELPHGFLELAAWLNDRWLAVMQWPPSDAGGAARGCERNAVHRRLAARTWTTVARAQKLAASHGAACADRVRFLAFLSQGLEWLVACVSPHALDFVERFVPDRLRYLIRDLRNPQAALEPAAQAVAQALREIAEEGVEASHLEAICPSPIAAFLPKLTARLARLDALEAEFAETVRREKLASLQKLAYGASHEINNPLANIATRAQTLLQDETDPERQRTLATINDQAFRAFEMIANMMLFAKPPEFDLSEIDLSVAARQVVVEMTPAAQLQSTLLETDFDPALPPVRSDATQFAVLLRALCRNALEAVACGGRVKISLCHIDDEQVQLAVRDTGPGLSEEARRHLFDPFYSSREAGRGLGFGLSWCWTIVERHGGRIAYRSDSAMGTTFSVTLPVGGPPDAP